METMNGAARSSTDEDASGKQGAGDTAAFGDTRQPPRLAEYLTHPSESWDKWMSAELKNIRGQRIPEYDAAIASCSVTLEQIVDVRYRGRHTSARTGRSRNTISAPRVGLVLF